MKDLQSSRKVNLWRSLSLLLLVALLTLIAAGYWYCTVHVSQMNNKISTLTSERNKLQDQLNQPHNNFESTTKSDLKSKTEHTSKNGQLVTVASPLANTEVASPLEITGTAPGNWFNEGIFDVVLENSSGTVIAKSSARMTGSDQTKPAKFKASLTWDGQETGNGILRLNKANPSGLEVNGDQVEIALKF